MARIRSIKPDFWTDERLSECSLSARLLFIGTWTFADDNGNLTRSAKKLKMQVLPADAIDCEPLIQELITHGLLSEYSVNGGKYLHIKGFKKHQIINRPSKSLIPQPALSECSVSAHEQLTDDSLTEEEEEEEEKDIQPIGCSGSPSGDPPPAPAAKTDPIPYRAIADLFNATLTGLPKVRDLTPKRKTLIRTAWNFSRSRQSIEEFWKPLFEEYADDGFCNGSGPYVNGHENWRPDFDYLLRPATITKIYERALDRAERRKSHG